MPSPDPAQPGTAELDAHCRAAGPDPLAVRAALTRPGPLPRTASGKLVKRALREWVDKEGLPEP